jgi:hypothetical protein
VASSVQRGMAVSFVPERSRMKGMELTGGVSASATRRERRGAGGFPVRDGLAQQGRMGKMGRKGVGWAGPRQRRRKGEGVRALERGWANRPNPRKK